MKKSMIILGAVAVAVVASADLSISFVNNTHGVSLDGTGSTFIPEGSIVQLLWSQGDNAASRLVDGEVGVGGTLKVNEFLLALHSTTEPTPFGFGSWSPLGGLYSSADVGGADINTGFFYARIFNGAAADSSFYYETTGIDGASWFFDPADPGNQTPYTDSIVAADAGVAAFIAIDANGTQVIPEPATFGLMAVAGLGMFLARKKARR